MRSGKIREVASDPNVSRQTTTVSADVSESRETRVSASDTSLERIDGEQASRPMEQATVGVSAVNVNDALAAVINRMSQFEKMIDECEKRAENERSREEARSVDKRGDNLLTQTVTAIMERLTTMEKKLHRKDEHERRRKRITVEDSRNISRKNGKMLIEVDNDEEAREEEDRVLENAQKDKRVNDGGRSSGIKLPRGGWLKNPFEELSFVGRRDDQNPMRFVHRFERIAEYEEVDERDMLHYFGRALRDNAAVWFELHEPETYEEAKATFLEHFWGEEEQARFRQRMYTGRYRPERGASMADYALEYARQAKLLKPPMSEHEIIRAIKGHYQLEVSREIRATTVSDLKDLVKLLNSIESEKGQAKREQLTANRSRDETSKVLRFKREITNPSRRYDYPRSEEIARRNARVEERWSPRGTEGNYNNKWRQNWNGTRDEIPHQEKYKGRYEFTDAKQEAQTRNASQSFGKNRYARRENRSREMNRDGDQKKGPTQGSSARMTRHGERDQKEDPVNVIRLKRILDEVDEEMREEQSVLVKNQRIPIVQLRFRATTVKALIDTGAQISALTKSAYDKLVAATEEMQVVPIRKFAIRGAFTEKGAMIANKVRLTFVLQDREFSHEFYVVERMAYEIILGIDFMSKARMIVRCGAEIRYEFEENANEQGTIASLTVPEAEVRLDEILNEYKEMFDGEIGRVTHYKHRIEMTARAPYKRRTYPVPDKHKAAVAEYLRNLEAKGIVSKSATQYVNPLVVVMKKNGRIRMCLDARELNKRMANDHAQPPTIDEVFRQIGRKKYFTTLDIADAFWQIPLSEESRGYTGFLFDGQTYVFNRMPFGLKTAGASFTRAMNLALGDEYMETVITYLDDVLIASETLEEHVRDVEEVLSRLCKAGFRLNKGKCEFMRTEITFLGHTFNEIKAGINEQTKTTIRDFSQPTNKKAIQSFLGLVNWDRRFVENLAQLTKPLEQILRKDVKFRWTTMEQEAFEKIKQAFDQAKNLYLTKAGYKYGVYVDASKNGLGAKLYQYRDEDENQYTIAYASRSLKGAELNYTITELECLAIVWALKKWHTTLLGRQVRVNTDHRALQFLETCVSNNSRIARWFAFLQEFDLRIVHIKGSSNGQADALSRSMMEAHEQDDQMKRIALIQDTADGINTENWIPVIRRAQDADDELHEAARERPDIVYERNGLFRVRNEEDDGDRVALPKNVTWEITRQAHRLLLHFGTDKIAAFMEQIFYGCEIAKMARDVVASCHTCLATKYYPRATEGEQYFVLPEEPGVRLSMDIFGPLPKSREGFRYLLVIMDQFSKYTKMYPMRNQSLETIKGVLWEEYFPDRGIPGTMLTDNGGQFCTDRWADFARECGFEVVKTSPYNPQSNPVERVMREIGRVVRTYASDRHHTWNRIVPRLEDVLNATVHSSTGFTPHGLHNEEVMELNIDERLKPRGGARQSRQDRVIEARENLRRAAEKRKRQFDETSTAPQYSVGDKVWCKLHRRSDAGRKTTRKIHLVYDGPYRVRNVVRRNAYSVEDLEGNSIGVYNSRQLRPHREARHRNAEARIARGDNPRIMMLQRKRDQENNGEKPKERAKKRSRAEWKQKVTGERRSQPQAKKKPLTESNTRRSAETGLVTSRSARNQMETGEKERVQEAEVGTSGVTGRDGDSRAMTSAITEHTQKVENEKEMAKKQGTSRAVPERKLQKARRRGNHWERLMKRRELAATTETRRKTGHVESETEESEIDIGMEVQCEKSDSEGPILILSSVSDEEDQGKRDMTMEHEKEKLQEPLIESHGRQEPRVESTLSTKESADETEAENTTSANNADNVEEEDGESARRDTVECMCAERQIVRGMIDPLISGGLPPEQLDGVTIASGGTDGR